MNIKSRYNSTFIIHYKLRKYSTTIFVKHELILNVWSRVSMRGLNPQIYRQIFADSAVL